MITLGGDLDSVTDDATSQQVARLVHRVLALIPNDYRSGSHVAVTTDPASANRLVVRIDAPVYGVADIAAQVYSMGDRRMEVTCQALARTPSCSRIRVECRTTPS